MWHALNTGNLRIAPITAAFGLAASLAAPSPVLGQRPTDVGDVVRRSDRVAITPDEHAGPASKCFYQALDEMLYRSEIYDSANGCAIGGGIMFGEDADLQLVDDVMITGRTRITQVAGAWGTFNGLDPEGGFLIEIFPTVDGGPTEIPEVQLCVDNFDVEWEFSDEFGLIGRLISVDVSSFNVVLPPGIWWFSIQPIIVGQDDWYYMYRETDSVIGSESYGRDGYEDHGTVCGVGPFDGDGYGVTDFTRLSELRYDAGDTALRVCGEVIGEPGLGIVVSGECPGDVAIEVSGGTPGASCALIWGFERGPGPIVPGCPELRVNIADARVEAFAEFDVEGVARFAGVLPPRACGWVDVQAIEGAPGCRKSPVIDVDPINWPKSVAEWSLVAENAGPGKRTGHAMVYDTIRRETILFGGTGDGVVPTDTWAWNGTEWRQVAVEGPGERIEHAMAFDEARGEIVLFGGKDGAGVLSDETWGWDGAQWSLLSTTGVPERNGHAMAYDPSREVVFLHGGWRDGLWSGSAPTYTWDGSDWAFRGSSGDRVHYGMTFDQNLNAPILYGGRGQGNRPVRDSTYFWNGEQFQWLRVIGPPAREYHAVSFDEMRGATVIAGGWPGFGTSNDDTWEFNGEDWRPVVTSAGLPPVAQHAMVFDRDRQVTVLYGGRDGNLEYADTWEMRYRYWIVSEPEDQFAFGDETVVMSTMVDGPERDEVSYQWRRNGLKLMDGGRISGATTPTLLIESTRGSDSGHYVCAVSTPLRDEIQTDPAGLTVIDPLLYVNATCPDGGPADIAWSYATASGRVAVLFALDRGDEVVPNGLPCAGTTLGLGATALRLVHVGDSTARGTGRFSFRAPARMCDGYMQLVDLETCALSDVVAVQ